MENKNYLKGFVPYAVAAAVMSLCGGFTASVPTAISSAWSTDAYLTFITLAYSLAAAAMAPIMGKAAAKCCWSLWACTASASC